MLSIRVFTILNTYTARRIITMCHSKPLKTSNKFHPTFLSLISTSCNHVLINKLRIKPNIPTYSMLDGHHKTTIIRIFE